ncbi:MAG: hypothetical protein AMXMBFR23_07040 [Chloroflexota bacterium]
MLRRLVTSPIKVTIKRWLRRTVIDRVPALERWRLLRRVPVDLRPAVEPWATAMIRQRGAAPPTHHESIAAHARDSFVSYLAVPLYAIPILLRARRIVELGTAFTYYPATYPGGSPWRVSRAPDEGMVTTRFLLSAAWHLRGVGIPATLTSVDIRSSELPIFANAHPLFSDLGVVDCWQPVFGTDSIGWLREQAGTTPIDFALVDSNHTFAHASAELEALAPCMAETAVIVVDNCYGVFYAHGDPPDVEEEARRGSKFGAVQAFIAAHPEWTPRWTSEGMMLLYRGQVNLSR